MYLFLGRDVVRSIFFLIFFQQKIKGGEKDTIRVQLKSAIVGFHLEISPLSRRITKLYVFLGPLVKLAGLNSDYERASVR